MTGSSRRMALVLSVTLIAAASISVSLSSPPTAVAQDRPPCGDGPANAWDQVRGEIIDSIMPDWVNHPYGPESIDDAASRCLNFGDPQPVPGLPGGPGTNRGDPHIVTQDGVAYDFQGAGDFVLLRSPANDVEMQVRYRRSKWVSLFTSVAIRVGDTTLTVENFDHGVDPVITLDGEVLEFADIGWYDLEIGFVMRTVGTVYVELTNGVRFEARRAGLTLLTPGAWAGAFEGIQGNGDGDLTNDLATADGTPVDAADTDALYGEFFDSWYVEPADSMFTIPFDVDVDGPIRPEEVVTLADLDPAEVAEARRVCLDAGLTPGSAMDDCTYDVTVTGDPFWAEDVAGADIPSVPAVGINPVVESSIALAATDSVAPERPAAGAGRIEQRYGADDFAVAAGDDTVRLLSVSEPCTEGTGPAAVVIVDGKPTRSLPLVCDAVHEVPSGAFTLRVIDPTGGTPTYGFAIAPAGVIKLGVLREGEEYSGELGLGDTVIGSLDLVAGQRVFVTSGDRADCGPVLRVLDRAGESLAPARGACLDVGPVELTGTPPFSLQIGGSAAGTYHFTVTEVGGDSVAEVAAGQAIDLEVATPGQRASATIELAAGERVYVETIESINGDLVATGPDGTEVAAAFSFQNIGLITATAAGAYTITIEPEDATTGVQRLVVHQVADDTVIAAALDSDVELVISTPGQRATATIELAAGEQVFVETVESVRGRLVVVGPDGTEMASVISSQDAGTVTAAAAGTYTITVLPEAAFTGAQVLQISRP